MSDTQKAFAKHSVEKCVIEEYAEAITRRDCYALQQNTVTVKLKKFNGSHTIGPVISGVQCNKQKLFLNLTFA